MLRKLSYTSSNTTLTSGQDNSSKNDDTNYCFTSNNFTTNNLLNDNNDNEYENSICSNSSSDSSCILTHNLKKQLVQQHHNHKTTKSLLNNNLSNDFETNGISDKNVFALANNNSNNHTKKINKIIRSFCEEKQEEDEEEQEKELISDNGYIHRSYDNNKKKEYIEHLLEIKNQAKNFQPQDDQVYVRSSYTNTHTNYNDESDIEIEKNRRINKKFYSYDTNKELDFKKRNSYLFDQLSFDSSTSTSSSSSTNYSNVTFGSRKSKTAEEEEIESSLILSSSSSSSLSISQQPLLSISTSPTTTRSLSPSSNHIGSKTSAPLSPLIYLNSNLLEQIKSIQTTAVNFPPHNCYKSSTDSSPIKKIIEIEKTNDRKEKEKEKMPNNSSKVKGSNKNSNNSKSNASNKEIIDLIKKTSSNNLIFQLNSSNNNNEKLPREEVASLVQTKAQIVKQAENHNTNTKTKILINSSSSTNKNVTSISITTPIVKIERKKENLSPTNLLNMSSVSSASSASNGSSGSNETISKKLLLPMLIHDQNYSNKMLRFKAALIQQKSKLKKSTPPSTNKKSDRMTCNSLESSLNSEEAYYYNNAYYDSLMQTKLEPSNSSNNSTNKQQIVTSNSIAMNSLIISRQGTVRGSVNHVKTSLKEIFKDPNALAASNDQANNNTVVQLNINNNYYNASNIVNSKVNDKPIFYNYLARNYEEEECQKIVIYTTTLQIVRLSFDKCKKVKKILQNHCVRYEEKDLYKNKEYQRELKFRLNINKIDVPHLFFNGKHIGNCDQLESYADQGYLQTLFTDLEKIKLRIYCCKCGGYRFVLCTWCNGSKKIFNSFTNLKCTTCNEDGLIRCDACLDQQE